MEENKKEIQEEKKEIIENKETEFVTIKLSDYKQLIKDSLHKQSYNDNKTNEIKKDKIIFVEENKEEQKPVKKPFFNFSRKEKK